MARVGYPIRPPRPPQLIDIVRRIFQFAWLPAGLLAASLAQAGDAGLRLVDITAESGLDFRYENGATGRFLFPEIMGGGAAVLDYDLDGRMDIYLVQGGRPDADPESNPVRDRLFRNITGDDGTRRIRFVDVTEASGIDARGYGQGVAVGDIDADGDPDLLVLNVGPNQLWRNDGNGRFTDITRTAGVAGKEWSVSGSIADLDGDGLPELLVINYVDWSPGRHRDCHAAGSSRLDYCSPSAYAPVADRLYHNLGGGRFRDVSTTAGLASAARPGLGAVIADFDSDGWLDLYVANDGTPNQYWLGRGGLRFEDDAFLAGNAVNAAGASEAGMGVDAGDVDRNGALDLFVTHLVRETNTLYLNDGQGWFRDATAEAGLGPPSLSRTGFGTGMVDLNLDGWLDLYVANGAVTIEAAQASAGAEWPFLQSDQLFLNTGGARFIDASAQAGPDLGVPHTGRGVAFGDFDDDGRVDLVIADNHGPVRLLHNRSSPARHWLGVAPDSRDPAAQPPLTVWLLDADGRRLWRHRSRRDGSYASANDSRVVFGLDDSDRPQAVEVHWADGRIERFSGLAVDRYHRLAPGNGQPQEGNSEP